jgi:2-C-methyl-D-erythritol 4-phosphate cytidylyltransferase
MKKYAVIVAAGAGLRMGGSLPKQFMLLAGKPVLWHTLRVFLDAYSDLEIILVVPEKYLEMAEKIVHSSAFPGRIRLVTGGETRFDSVRRGLSLVQDPSVVFVHDGVRCLVTMDLIYRCYDMAIASGNAIPVMKSTDSIRIELHGINTMVDRNCVRIVQTPQTFLSHSLLAAFDQQPEGAFTDEAAVVEKHGIEIHLVEGEETNIKITRPIDLLVAGRILEERGTR